MHITCAICELGSTQPVNIPIEQENFPINECVAKTSAKISYPMPTYKSSLFLDQLFVYIIYGPC